MKIFLFRHGEIDNPNHVLPGRLPGFHLSEIGREHVRKTAGKLKAEKIAKIYTSPLERTVETAQIIAEVIGLNPEHIQVQNELIEVQSNLWQGKAYKDFLEKSEYVKNPNITTDMESRHDSGKRVVSFLDKIPGKDSNVVVVSHGDPIMGAFGLVTGKWDKIDDRYIKRGEYIIAAREKGGRWKITG